MDRTGHDHRPQRSNLTRRQAEVCRLLLQGKSNKAIGRVLGISEPTVKHHVSAVLKSLGANTRAEAVALGSARKHDSTKADETAATWAGSSSNDAPVMAQSSAPAEALSGKPFLAVLPFTNLTGNLSQDAFIDGFVEQIITALSRIRWFFVIARNSSFTYKGRAVDVRQVGRELGVRYVLEGAVRRSGRIVRVSSRLIDAQTGANVWADSFIGASPAFSRSKTNSLKELSVRSNPICSAQRSLPPAGGLRLPL